MHYKYFILTLIFVFSLPFLTFAQTVYKSEGFVTHYTLYYVTENKNDKELPVYVRVVDDKEDKVIFEVGDAGLMPDKIQEYVDIDLSKLPKVNAYFIEDYNFDGAEDYALEVQTEDEGCYHNMAYCIFLSGQIYFVYNEAITQLYNKAGCMRSSDISPLSTDESILISTSAGMGSAVEEKYKWADGELILFEEIMCDYSQSQIFVENEGKKRDEKSGEWKNISFKTLQAEVEPIYAFETANGKGRVMLFNQEGYLYYAFCEDEGRIYFSYPVDSKKADAYKFVYTETLVGLNQLEFKSGAVSYSIYENTQTNYKGIRINVKGKVSDWVASDKNTFGRLSNIKDAYENSLPINVEMN